MTTREQVEAEAEAFVNELYPNARENASFLVEMFVAGRTVTAEQVEASAEVLAEMTGEPRAGRFERTMTRAALTAAGLIVEDDDE